MNPLMGQPINVTIRGYKSGKLLWTVHRLMSANQMESLAPEHVAAMIEGTLGVVEIEFLDEPDPLQRFMRLGVETDGMVMPARLDLEKR